ncbi:starvation-sensing protein RspA [bacterium]|nr:starvation-sensing protein RspA [bacterium]
MNRRNMMKWMGLGASAGILKIMGQRNEAIAQTYAEATRALPPLTVTRVKNIAVRNLNVVKVETSEPGLYGLGCATFQQRPRTVATAVDEYLSYFAVGRSADNIEDMWQNGYTSSYWRNGPVLNNALSGLDEALWDIKGKRANMPVYQLLGGKCRFAVPSYGHASGRDLVQLEESVKRYMEEGYRYIRIQLGAYGSPQLSSQPDFQEAEFGLENDSYMDPGPYMREMPKAFEHIRNTCGEEIELLHDIHERIDPIDAINLIKELAQYRPFFIEDPFSPEQIGWFRILREQCTVPIAMGELFNSPHEWVGPMSERLFDYIRVHISQCGGLSVARKIAILGEIFGIKTAWHGPGDVSPVGHAANLHLDLASWNFGIQEAGGTFSDQLREIFPGCPTFKDGFVYVNEAPGLGVDIDEEAAAKAGARGPGEGIWNPVRRSDGTAVRP